MPSACLVCISPAINLFNDGSPSNSVVSCTHTLPPPSFPKAIVRVPYGGASILLPTGLTCPARVLAAVPPYLKRPERLPYHALSFLYRRRRCAHRDRALVAQIKRRQPGATRAADASHARRRRLASSLVHASIQLSHRLAVRQRRSICRPSLRRCRRRSRQRRSRPTRPGRSRSCARSSSARSGCRTTFRSARSGRFMRRSSPSSPVSRAHVGNRICMTLASSLLRSSR